MQQNSSLIGPLLQSFFIQHLQLNKRVSSETIASYRDTLKLLLQYIKKQKGKEPTKLTVEDLDVDVILCFLDYLEKDRNNSIRSRNARLAAIRTFFRWVALREPRSVSLATRILAIPPKRSDKKLVKALSRTEVEAIISATDLTEWKGRRDNALLLTLYNSGARVSEIISLQRHQIHFGVNTFLQLYGKGRKERTVPLWTKTSRVLQNWFHELEDKPSQVVFPNARGKVLSRDGVEYILKQTVMKAKEQCHSLNNQKVSPHTLRHTTAMHLLQSGVDISVIALWLGHESIETTHMYLEADLQTKQKALEKLNPIDSLIPKFKPTDEVLAFLTSL